MRAVNHDGALLALVLEGLLGSLNALFVKVGAASSATEDNEAMGVTLCACDGSKTLLCNTKEVVLGGGSADGINGDAEVTVGTVLETNGEREARGKLTVQLGLGGAGTNSTDGNAVGQELRRDGIKHLASNGHASSGKVDKELARHTQTLVDLERRVDIGVVDQTLPADGSSRLLQVGTHNNAEIIAELVSENLELGGVLVGSFGVVDGAGADDNEQTVVAAHDDVGGVISSLDHCVDSLLRHGNLRSEQGGGDEGILAED